MTPKEVLEKILANKGSCHNTFPDFCNKCPLGNIRRPNGQKMSCLEYVGADRLSLETNEDLRDIDTIYMDAAADKLMEIQIEEVLTEDADHNGPNSPTRDS